jgi:hypothetical protein
LNNDYDSQKQYYKLVLNYSIYAAKLFKNDNIKPKYSCDGYIDIYGAKCKGTARDISREMERIIYSACPALIADIYLYKKDNPDMEKKISDKIYSINLRYIDMPTGYFE